MGRLNGFRYRDVAGKLGRLGCRFRRHGAGSHEVWYNPLNNQLFTVPSHPGDLPEGTLRSILRQAGIDVDVFLKA